MPDIPEISTLEEALILLRRGELTALALAERCLDRIDALDFWVRGFVTLTRDRALVDAAASDERRRRGDERLLDGVPVAIKDVIATRGIPTTAGSRVLADWVPEVDASVARALVQAGTILLGKTNAHEFAFGTFTPPTRNPWNREHIPGGSSGGSAAAVAARMCLGAVGTDTGGSIRMPAACCGVTGFKPTYGLVNVDGVIPLSWSLDHVGPIAPTVRDCALLLDAMLEGVPPHYSNVAADAPFTGKLRLGVPSNYFFSCIDPEVEAAVRTAIDDLAALDIQVEEVHVPEAIADLFGLYLTIQRSEARVAHEDAGWFPVASDLYLPTTRGALEQAAEHRTIDYIRALRAKEAFTREMEDLFRRIDVLATPTLPLVAPLVADLERPHAMLTVAGREEQAGPALVRLTFPFDISGQPALTLPCGFSASGLPIGLQLIGRAR